MSYYYLILLIISVLTFVYTEVQLIRQKRTGNALTVALAMVTVWTHFIITWYKMIYEPDYDPVGFMQRLDIITTSLLIPLLYIYLARQFGLKLLCATTYCVFGILILCFFSRIYFVLDDVVPNVSLENTNVYIFLNGKAIWIWNIYEICLFFQSAVMLFKVFRLKLRMTQNNWSLTDNSNRLFATCLGTLAFTILIAFVDDMYWNGVTKFIYLTTFAALICTLLIMVAKGYDIEPVVDENKETQYLEVKPKFALMSEAFEKLINEKQIFLNGHLSIEEVAQMLGTNRTYVTRMVKECYGETFTAIINKHRLDYAKKYMSENPGMKLDVVAAESGFGSTSAFSKVFKEAEGISPSQWK